MTRPITGDLANNGATLLAKQPLMSLGGWAMAAAKASATRSSSGEPRLFSSASQGKKDDLKLISGVGPKLERLLNTNGVYYFWQVASWNKADVEFIDDRLQAFKGRIARDNWVSQAKQLRREPSAARQPS